MEEAVHHAATIALPLHLAATCVTSLTNECPWWRHEIVDSWQTFNLFTILTGLLRHNKYQQQKQNVESKTLGQDKDWAICYPALPEIQLNIAPFWKVSRRRPFLVLVCATCRWRREWTKGGMILTGENSSTGRETGHGVTLSTINFTWIAPGSKAGIRGDRLTTNLNYL